MAFRSAQRTLTIGLAALLFAATTAPLSASAATSTTIDFTSAGYTLGYHSPATQNGWWMAKSVDFSLVANSDFPASGLGAQGRSLQFSNATHQSGGAHLISPLVDPAGEASTGATANTFETTFTVASATGALQPGLAVDVALDGASRYGGVINLRHSADGLAIGSYWLPAGAADESLTSWRSAVFVTVDPKVAHVIRAVAVFREDAADTLDIYVDGALVSAGTGATTWEAFSGSNGGDRSVDSLSFKTTSSAPSADGIGYQAGLPAAPATAGKGFLFANISYGVRMTLPETPIVPPTPTPSPTSTPKPSAPAPAPAPTTVAEPVAAAPAPLTIDAVIEQFGADTEELLANYLSETGRDVPPDLEELFTVEGEIDLSDFTAWLSWTGDETVKLYGYSTPTYLGEFPVVNGQAQISGVDLTALGEGEHHLLVVGGQSGASELVQLEVPASETVAPPVAAAPAPTEAASTGLPIWMIAAIAGIALLALVALVLLLRRRFA